MAAVKDINVTVRESGIALTLGVKTQILEDADIEALIRILREMQPQVLRARKERIKAEITTLKQKLEDLQNQLDLLRNA